MEERDLSSGRGNYRRRWSRNTDGPWDKNPLSPRTIDPRAGKKDDPDSISKREPVRCRYDPSSA
ncbi:unnamed protein product [Lupinus luteus]|uniref:Uncharacterized protein n=1 Tax=Lupinus luteus TaxID=3873 RepID=A0AAV1XNR4_LUPLU